MYNTEVFVARKYFLCLQTLSFKLYSQLHLMKSTSYISLQSNWKDLLFYIILFENTFIAPFHFMDISRHLRKYMSNSEEKWHTVRAEIFAVVLFSRISRVKPSRKFPLQFMSIYSNDNISKIAKLTTRELPHLAKTAKITVRENNGVYSI